MYGPDILCHCRIQLAEEIGFNLQPIPCPEPLSISPWVAMSVLQKSIRRGECRLALLSAATLLRNSPDRLWRRLGGIAFEDIGLGDIKTVSLVTAALAGKRVRAAMGGEWAVACHLVSRMAQAPKDRATDDLLMTAELHPAYDTDRLNLAEIAQEDSLAIVTGKDEMPRRALALWYALGTNLRASPRLVQRRGDPSAVFDHLRQAGHPETVVEIAREGFRRTGEVLAPFLALLYPSHQVASKSICDDYMPPVTMFGPVPSWALDRYSREGKSAVSHFLCTDAPTAQWVEEQIPPRERLDFLAGLVFRVEGGLLRNRVRWPLADELRRMFEIEANGSGVTDGSEALDLMRVDIPILNGVRADVV